MTAMLPLMLASAAPDAAAVMAEPTASSLSGALGWVLWLAGVAMLCGMGLCLYRIMRGPHLADRVLAADAFSLHVVGLVLLLSASIQSTIYFDVALVVAIIGFASTVAFSQYIYARAAADPASAQPQEQPAP